MENNIVIKAEQGMTIVNEIQVQHIESIKNSLNYLDHAQLDLIRSIAIKRIWKIESELSAMFE
jgi:hypothetical protein